MARSAKHPSKNLFPDTRSSETRRESLLRGYAQLLLVWYLLLAVFTVFNTVAAGFRTGFAGCVMVSVLFALGQTLSTSILAFSHDSGCARPSFALASALNTLPITGHAGAQAGQTRWIFRHGRCARIDTLQARIRTRPTHLVRVFVRLGTCRLRQANRDQCNDSRQAQQYIST